MQVQEVRLFELVSAIGETLTARQWRLAVAESCTGGGLAKALTDMPGSSMWFDRGWVTYSNAAKHEQLAIPLELIERHGAVSEAVVRAMVAGVLRVSRVEVAAAITGIAGPSGGTPDKPVGTVWFGFACRDAEIETRRARFDGDRSAVREQAIVTALQGILQCSRVTT